MAHQSGGPPSLQPEAEVNEKLKTETQSNTDAASVASSNAALT